MTFQTKLWHKPFLIMINKVDGFNRDYAGTKYLVLIGLENYDASYDMIRYLIGLKSSIAYVFSQNQI